MGGALRVRGRVGDDPDELVSGGVRERPEAGGELGALGCGGGEEEGRGETAELWVRGVAG